MTLWLQFAAEPPQDPIWLRTLATVLPVAGTIVVAILTGPKILARMKEKREAKANGTSTAETSIHTDAAIAAAATEQTINNPILRLFIDDLHTRLSKAHEEMANLHNVRASDAATIARLTEELGSTTDRVAELTQAAEQHAERARELIRRVKALRLELRETRDQLRDCYRQMDKEEQAHDASQPTDAWAGPREQGGDGDLG